LEIAIEKIVGEFPRFGKVKAIRSTIQPFLFVEMATDQISIDASHQAGKTVVEKLLKVRRGLNPEEEHYLIQINACIEQIRSVSRLNDRQREEVILFAIEVQGAITVKEISEDTRLSVDIVKDTLRLLIRQKIVYETPRYVPGSGRQYFMYKSNRVKTPEAV
jgi:hypothetical protein